MTVFGGLAMACFALLALGQPGDKHGPTAHIAWALVCACVGVVVCIAEKGWP